MLKEREMIVLYHLRQDVRKKFTLIGRETGIPVTTIYDYFKKLEKLTTKNAMLIDFTKLGYRLKTMFVVECYARDKLLKFLEKNKSINNIFLSDNEIVIFDCIFRNVLAKRDFTDKLRKIRVKNYKSYELVKEEKREAFLPQQSL